MLCSEHDLTPPLFTLPPLSFLYSHNFMNMI